MADDDKQPIVRNQPAPGDLKRGDYVFASRWGDCDPGDPWEVGFVSLVGEGYVVLSSPRRWPKAMRITPEQGHRICAQYPAMEEMPQDYEAIAKVFGVTPPGELEYASWISTLGVPASWRCPDCSGVGGCPTCAGTGALPHGVNLPDGAKR